MLLFFILLSPLYPRPINQVFAKNIFDFRYLPYVVANGVFLALLWIFLNRTLRVASASYMTMMSMMTPVILTALALVFLKESIEPIQILGAIFIISSGFVTHYLKIEKQ